MAYDNKQQFLADITPHAMRVAAQTGVDPRLIIAQAAHESAWGSKAPGNNYFGIKSHTRPGGNSLTTTEHVNGQDVKMKQSFRQYNNIGESVDDYGKFLQNNPRYAKVLAAKDLDSQIAAMGASGYATDPNYASKLSRTAKSIGLPDAANVQVASTQPAQPQMKYDVSLNPYSFGANKPLYQPSGLLAQDAPAATPVQTTPGVLARAGQAISDAIVSPAAAADNPPIPAGAMPRGPVNTAADSANVGNPLNPAYAPGGLTNYHKGRFTGPTGRPVDDVTGDFEVGSEGQDKIGSTTRSGIAPAWQNDFSGWVNAQKQLEARNGAPSRPYVPLIPRDAAPAPTPALTPGPTPAPAPAVQPAVTAAPITPPAVPQQRDAGLLGQDTPPPPPVVPQNTPPVVPQPAVTPPQQQQPPAPQPDTTWADPNAPRNTVTVDQALGAPKPQIAPIPPQQRIIEDPQFDPMGNFTGVTTPRVDPTFQPAPLPAGQFDFARQGLLGDGPKMPQGTNPPVPTGPMANATPITPDPTPDPTPVVPSAPATRDTSNDAILGDSQNMNPPSATSDADQKDKWRNTIAGLTDAAGKFAQIGKRGAPPAGIATAASYNLPKVSGIAQLHPYAFQGGTRFRGLLG